MFQPKKKKKKALMQSKQLLRLVVGELSANGEKTLP